MANSGSFTTGKTIENSYAKAVSTINRAQIDKNSQDHQKAAGRCNQNVQI